MPFLALYVCRQQTRLHDRIRNLDSKPRSSLSTTHAFTDALALQLDTSSIRQNLSHVLNPDTSKPANSILNEITDSVQGGINGSIDSFARYLSSHDFYSIYVLNLCEGQYSSDEVRPVLMSDSNRRNITSCGDKTFTFNFDLRKTLGLQADGSEDHSIDTPKSSWPPEVESGMRAFETIPRVMSIVYCISLALTTVALALAVFGIFLSGRCSACVNIMSSSIATLAAGVASILATLLGKNTAGLINAEATQINISAQTGTKFLRLTWAATACMLAASLLWCLACIRGR